MSHLGLLPPTERLEVQMHGGCKMILRVAATVLRQRRQARVARAEMEGRAEMVAKAEMVARAEMEGRAEMIKGSHTHFLFKLLQVYVSRATVEFLSIQKQQHRRS